MNNSKKKFLLDKLANDAITRAEYDNYLLDTDKENFDLVGPFFNRDEALRFKAVETGWDVPTVRIASRDEVHDAIMTTL